MYLKKSSEKGLTVTRFHKRWRVLAPCFCAIAQALFMNGGVDEGVGLGVVRWLHRPTGY